MKFRRLAREIRNRVFRKPRFNKTDFDDEARTKVHADLSPSVLSHKRLDAIIPVHRFDGESFTEWRSKGSERLSELLGLGPELLGSPIRESIRMWEATDKLATYRKFLLIDDDGQGIPVYHATPSAEPNPQNWVVCLQGHTSGMHMTIGVDHTERFHLTPELNRRNFGVGALKRNYGVIAIEQASLGERAETRLKKVAPHPCFDASMHHILLGSTLMGQRVADIGKTIKHFRNEAKQAQTWIVMGNSLGGSTALYASIFLDEIDVCVASCCVADFSHSLLSVYHCADLYIPALAKFFSMSDIVGLVAPKKLILCAGVADPIFPITGFRNVFTGAKVIFDAASKAGHLRAVIGMGGHHLYEDEIFSELSRSLRTIPE